MRERLWFALRKSAPLRRLYALPALSGLLRSASYLLVPSSRRVRMQVQAGPGRGLILDVSPRWEHTFLEGDYEATVQSLIEMSCKPGVTLYDVGANFGYYTLLAIRLGADVVSFEPDTANAENLLLHARLNGVADRVRLERSAVFSHTGEIFLSPAGGGRPHGNAHVYASAPQRTDVIHVPCTTLDSFAASHTPPGIVKIDVEGAESEVLKGAGQTFESVRPLLICEVHDAYNEKFISSWLRERKYATTWLESADTFPRQLFAWPVERGELAGCGQLGLGRR